MKTSNLLIVSLMILSQLFAPMSFAADTASATMNLSGNVPVVFSVTARGYPGDLDLSPGVIVNDRLLGIFHFKYNVDMATLTLTASTASGTPENATAVAYGFGAAGFKVRFSTGCTSVIAANQAVFVASNAGTELSSAWAKDLETTGGGNGVEEDCSLLGSWAGTTATLPLSGKYSETFTLTMVSI